MEGSSTNWKGGGSGETGNGFRLICSLLSGQPLWCRGYWVIVGEERMRRIKVFEVADVSLKGSGNQLTPTETTFCQ